MRAAALLSALLLVRAAQAAVPDAGALAARALPDGFAPGVRELLFAPAPVRSPLPVLIRPRRLLPDTRSVALGPLLDRHWRSTDALTDRQGSTLLAGTLDLDGNGYLSVITPSGRSLFVKIERGMFGRWNVGARVYEVNLSVNIFRARLSNIIQIKDANTRQLLWERRINELFRLTYAAGEKVVLAGRPYSMFYSHLPDTSLRPAIASSRLGLAFIYEELVDHGRDVDYKFYLIPLEQLLAAAPVPYRMFGGDLVRFQAASDLSVLNISR